MVTSTVTTTTSTVRARAEGHALDRAVELAERGPIAGGNPRVGCVLLDPTGAVLGEGLHLGAGSPHAEAVALSAVPASRRAELSGATAVLTLEPCHHHGRTPPCSQALHDAGVTRVVHAVADPDETAAGGAAWLRSVGVEALTSADAGIAPAATARAEELTRSWAAAVRRRRPWLVAKTATSLDGRVAAADGTSRWITGPASRAHAHSVRADTDAVVVGTGTVAADDPALTARDADGPLAEQPLRVVVGERDVPPAARLRRGPGQWHHVRTHDLTAVLEELYGFGARHVLLEGGPTLLGAALRAGLVDELHAYVAPVLVGGGTAAVRDLGVTTITDALRWRTVSTQRLGDDLFLIARPEGAQ
ncbi:bifunctional diaminohydroxyphosphoribosylaminopyrimidine deaminase/5-amino-6-(5-phosphoribosylamino)uracil reductase RibD [Georgenia halophila]|uniref:Riboflavin biosynthesis protein RibD n=1 Tax=Georgenia halophila TaxID=620889 RepID=A0ABP8LAH8_9MICO